MHYIYHYTGANYVNVGLVTSKEDVPPGSLIIFNSKSYFQAKRRLNFFSRKYKANIVTPGLRNKIRDCLAKEFANDLPCKS